MKWNPTNYFGPIYMTSGVGTNGTTTLSSVNFSEYVREHVTIFS